MRRHHPHPSQVFGATEKLASAPLDVRAMGWWTAAKNTGIAGWEVVSRSTVGRLVGRVLHSGVLLQVQNFLWKFMHAMWLFFLTFWPGYDGGRVEGLRREGDEENGPTQPVVQFRQRVETTARACRDEINSELVERGPRGGPPP